MSWRDRIAIAIASGLLMLILAFVLCLVAWVAAFRFGLSRLGMLIITAMVMAGCAHQPPPIQAVPVEERIVLHAYTPQHVELCVENPDIWIATKPRLVCKRLIEVREWYALQRAAD